MTEDYCDWKKDYVNDILKLEQMKRFGKLPFLKKLEILEQMNELARKIGKDKTHNKLNDSKNI